MTEKLASTIIPLYDEHAAAWARLRPITLFERPWIGTFEGQPLFHASLAPEAYRHLLQENGFRVVNHVVEDPACGGRTIWLAQRIE
ncbi:hypothetical protein SME22J_18340 [Serratia marcescens]|nr:hypothetical protein SME22J_18340 [Serratia marcescens]